MDVLQINEHREEMEGQIATLISNFEDLTGAVCVHLTLYEGNVIASLYLPNVNSAES